MKPVALPIVMLLVAAVLVAILVARGALEIYMAAIVLTNLLLVGITWVYVSLTGGLLTESQETGVSVKDLAAKTADLAEAAGQQADVAHRALSHLQRPVLVLRVLQDAAPDDKEILLQVQNVGEAAAIWPKVRAPGCTGTDNLLGDRPPHIFPPQQFEGDVPPDQHVAVPKPTSDSANIRLECDDPRTGEVIERVWLLYPLDEDRVEWCARPVREGEDSRP